MKNYTLKQRADFYNESFPRYASFAWLQASEYWLWGIWSIGNNYKGSGFYGSYPPRYLDRVRSLFPDADLTLHLFSGSLKPMNGEHRFDINQPAEFNGDAHNLTYYVGENSYDLIIADPPYSDEDANHYGAPMINRNKVVNECVKVLKQGGFLVWLDQTLPMYRKAELNRCISIGIERSTNHRFRQLVGWKKI